MAVIHKTQSVCPECLERLDAAYVERDGRVFLEKNCAEHGSFSVPIAPDAQLFRRWMPDTVNIPPKQALTETGKGCPYDCGPCQSHEQTACCVLVEVTQRCNQHCPYCYAGSGEAVAADPTLEEIAATLDFLAEQSEARPFNIQLSGGEPTVRDDLPRIVEMCAERGFPYIQLNTNGRRIAEEPGYAEVLKKAGVSAVFMQFDGMDDHVNRALRGEALQALKLKAIENCRRARLAMALVPVVVPGVNEAQIGQIVRFAAKHVDTIKGVHFQPVSYFGRYPAQGESHATMFGVMAALESQTGGEIKAEDFFPTSAGHGLCCFNGTFLVGQDGVIRSSKADGALADCCTTLVDCCETLPALDDEACCCGADDSAACCPAEDSCCPGEAPADALSVIARDRDFVKTKWALPETDPANCCDSLDAFLQATRSRSLTITGMHFQDAWNLDLERVARCRVQITDAGRLIPFCAYNLTSAGGQALYRGNAARATLSQASL